MRPREEKGNFCLVRFLIQQFPNFADHDEPVRIEWMPYFPSVIKKPSKTDVTLYAIGALLGVAIVISNYYAGAMETRNSNPVDRYLERIISRMDAVSGQLSTWGAIDIRQNRAGY